MSASPEVAPDIAAALDRVPAARAAFDAMPPSHRREHLTYIEAARKPDTRARRIERLIETLS